jgi:hypothetical protein
VFKDTSTQGIARKIAIEDAAQARKHFNDTVKGAGRLPGRKTIMN